MAKANLAVLGHPVSHSLSPVMHNAAIEHLGLSDRFYYSKLEVLPENLPHFLDQLQRDDFAGVNLTVPLKEAGFDYALKTFGAERISPVSLRSKSVNTLVFRGSSAPFADTTDGTGLFNYLADRHGFEVNGRSVLILGAGGTARSVLAAALGTAGDIHIANRTPAKADAICAEFEEAATPVTASGLDPNELAHPVSNASVIINTTSAGLAGETIHGFPWGEVRDNCLVFDAMYGREIPFLTEARKHRLKAVDGLGMLVHQGALALSMWTGVSTAKFIGVMFEAAQDELNKRG